MRTRWAELALLPVYLVRMLTLVTSAPMTPMGQPRNSSLDA